MNGPLNRFEVIAPSDTIDLPRYTQTKQLTDGIYVGTATTQDIVAVMVDGTLATFKNVIAGTILPIGVRRIQSAGTSASNLLALYQI